MSDISGSLFCRQVVRFTTSLQPDYLRDCVFLEVRTGTPDTPLFVGVAYQAAVDVVSNKNASG